MSRVLYMARVGAFVFLCASLACAQKDPNQACLNATELHRAGKVQDAIPDYQACVKLHPDVLNCAQTSALLWPGWGATKSRSSSIERR